MVRNARIFIGSVVSLDGESLDGVLLYWVPSRGVSLGGLLLSVMSGGLSLCWVSLCWVSLEDSF